MKSIILIFFVSFLFFSCKEKEEIIQSPINSEPNWEMVSSLPGSYLYLKTKGNSIYMICYKDNYKFAVSQDSGKSWGVTNLGFSLPDGYGFLSVTGGTFYISGRNNMFKSTDNGLTWSADSSFRNFVCPNATSFCLFDIRVTSDTIIVAQLISNEMGSNINGLIISKDGGLTWYCPDVITTPLRVRAIEKTGSIIICSNSKVSCYDFLFNNWQNSAGISSQDPEINEFIKVGSRIFGMNFIKLNYSDVSGLIWQDTNLPLVSNEFIIPHSFTFNNSQVFLLSTKQKIYFTKQSDLSWEIMNTQLPAFDSFPIENQTLFTLGDDYLYYISKDKLWRRKII